MDKRIRVKVVVDRFSGVDPKLVKRLLENSGVVITDKGYELAVIVGGDGTFLKHAVKHIGVPIIPIKKVRKGHSGGDRIAKYMVRELPSIIRKFAGGDYRVTSEPLLELRYMGRRYLSAGDFYVERRNVKQAMRYSARIYENGRLLHTRATSNGFVVTTPIGSTGYFSYMEVLRKRPAKRISGMGFAHILPASVTDKAGGRKMGYKVRRVLAPGSKITVTVHRGQSQYLYGIPAMDRGIRVDPRKKMVFRLLRDRLKILEV